MGVEVGFELLDEAVHSLVGVPFVGRKAGGG